MRKAKRPIKQPKFPAERAKIWVVANIEVLQPKHAALLADGWEFKISAIRFYPRKDGLTVMLKYRKKAAAYTIEDIYRFRLSGVWSSVSGAGGINLEAQK
ncbi:hypothetical protein [Candidatus Tokpelaia sp.]|uniref:hypothetical protein n=1 Tax=Candidatus Tokpelaia sp. TaxID=2233777 RepID=UPI001238C9B0|nr:hypothetical protein [Candidatus Tokpelaia sp.]KAA6405775.1 hypothetical protein DPQ22_02825 [Candidatus Tokpelaia sp.]